MFLRPLPYLNISQKNHYKLRLRLAGIPVEKTVCVFDEQTIPDYVSTDGIESIYVLHDVTTVLRAKKIKDKIKEKITNQ